MQSSNDIIETYARLNFLENHTRFQAEELAKKDEKISEMADEIKELKDELNRITEFLKLAGKKIYGSSTERLGEDYGQLSFFENDEKAVVPEIESVTKIASHERRKRRTLKEMFKGIEIKEIVHELSDEEKICPECGSEMTVIGTDSFLQVEYIPARISVEKHIRQKAVCKKCSKNEKAVFNTAKAPFPLIEGSFMTPSLLSHIICEKYVKSVPLYRIEQECRWSGMNFSRQTFCNNIIAAADILKPLYELFHKYLVKLKILHADETPHQVNVVRGHKGKVRGYMWVYRSGRYEHTPLVMYEYRNGRKAEYPRDFLAGFTGALHCDGLKQYDYVRDVIRVGCYAHLRRYFLNAVNVQHNKKDLTTPAGTGLRMINEIFYTENRDPEKPYERSSYTLPEIKRIRAEKSKKLAERFFEWCEKQPVGNDLFGRAIGYALSQKRSLMNVFLDPKLELTNNAAERAVKSVVMGRKNWLFAHCERGAEANAVLYTIVETAKANLLKPYEYIKWVLERIRNVDFKSFEELLPWNKDLPEYFRVEGC